MRARKLFAGLAALLATSSIAAAQRFGDVPRQPYVAGAVGVGPVGFMNAGMSAGTLLGGYGYLSFSRMMLGVQGGGLVADPARMRYAIATLAYPARMRRRSRIYPFVGAGGGALPTTRLATSTGMIFGAGVGVDRITGGNDHGVMIGLRGGYLYRSGDGYERAVYLALSVGGATQLRRDTPEPAPPVIVATR